MQGLRPSGFERRQNFIAIMQVMMYNPDVLSQKCWSDESRFHNNGVLNKHNVGQQIIHGGYDFKLSGV